MASYFDSKKGRRKLAYQGYSYLKHTDGSAGSGLVLWRCDAYQRLGCSGRARVHDDTEVVLTAPHSHPPAPAPQLIRSKAVLADIRRRARGAKAGAQRQSLGPAGMFAPAATVANPALLDEVRRKLQHKLEELLLYIKEFLEKNV
jgi:hypothetical protein